MAIKREPTMTFLGVLLDENLNWKEHINYIENKISKSMGILYKSRFLLNEQCTKNLYFCLRSFLLELWKCGLGKYYKNKFINFTAPPKTRLAYSLFQRQIYTCQKTSNDFIECFKYLSTEYIQNSFCLCTK